MMRTGRQVKSIGHHTSHNKYVSGSAHFVRSDLHGPGLLWHESEVQRILEVTVRPRFVVATSETSERYMKLSRARGYRAGG
jgi:hypothetical protein